MVFLGIKLQSNDQNSRRRRNLSEEEARKILAKEGDQNSGGGVSYFRVLVGSSNVLRTEKHLKFIRLKQSHTIPLFLP